jgi:uncharacterized membrane protein YkoI
MLNRVGLAIAGLFLVAATGPSPDPLWGYIGLGVPAEKAGDIKPFGLAKLSTSQVIDQLQQQNNARVVEIGFAHKGSDGWYQALVTSAGGLRSLRVDPATGAVSKGDQPDLARADLDASAQRDLDAINSAPVDLRQAVASVEQTTGGRVIAAGIEQLVGIPQYYVQSVGKGKLAAFIVNPQTGRVAIPSD